MRTNGNEEDILLGYDDGSKMTKLAVEKETKKRSFSSVNKQEVTLRQSLIKIENLKILSDP